jgi:O-antigen ligase
VWPYLGGGVSWDTVLDSQYAQLLIETGFLGLFTFLFMLYRILRTARQTQRWSRDWIGQGLGLALMGASVGLIVHGFGTISFLIVRIMEPFWFLMALTVVARDVAIRDHAQRVAAYQVEHPSPSEEKSGVSEPIAARKAPA